VSKLNLRVLREPNSPNPCTVVNRESNVKSSLGNTIVKMVPTLSGIGLCKSMLNVAYSYTVSLLAYTLICDATKSHLDFD
jgi:hypothetical protein